MKAPQNTSKSIAVEKVPIKSSKGQPLKKKVKGRITTPNSSVDESSDESLHGTSAGDDSETEEPLSFTRRGDSSSIGKRKKRRKIADPTYHDVDLESSDEGLSGAL